MYFSQQLQIFILKSFILIRLLIPFTHSERLNKDFVKNTVNFYMTHYFAFYKMITSWKSNWSKKSCNWEAFVFNGIIISTTPFWFVVP